MSQKMKARVYKVLGLGFSILPGAVTALTYFPLWIQTREGCFSLVALCLLGLCALPAGRVLRRAYRNPSPWLLWLTLLVGLTLAEGLIEELRCVAAVGLPFSLVGAVFFRLSHLTEEKRNESV